MRELGEGKLEDMKVLDVGCGHEVKRNVPRGNVNLDIARPEFKINNFVLADAHHLPFIDGCFEKVVCSDVIEHVENPSQCLREIHRVLTTNGEAIVQTPQPYLFRKIFRKLVGLNLHDDNPRLHIATWTEIEMRNLLTHCGFTILSFNYVFFPTAHKTFDKALSRINPVLGSRGQCFFVRKQK